MKTLLATLLLFTLMLALIAINARYLSSVSAELTAVAEALADASDDDLLTALEQLWRSERDRVSLTVPSRVTEGIDGAISELRAAERHGDAFALERARCALLRLASELSLYGGIRLGGLLGRTRGALKTGENLQIDGIFFWFYA